MNIVGETQSESSTVLNKTATARWKLGTCASLNSIESGATYQYPAIYTERCCLESGRHTLVCYNHPPARGWSNAYIMINGQRYCDDFISYKSFQKVLVTGTNITPYFCIKNCSRTTSNIFQFIELIFILKGQIKSGLLHLYCHGKSLDQGKPQPQ